MPVYPTKEPNKWLVRINWKGKKYTFRVSGKRADAVALEARKSIELEAQQPVGELRVAPTFSDFCVGRYKLHAKVHLRESTWKVRQYQIATLCEHFGKLKLTEIAPDLVEEYTRKRLDQVRVISINNELAVLQAILTYAANIRIPVAKFEIKFLPIKRKNRVIAWSSEDVARLYASVEKHCPRLLSLVVFLANTGCRVGEALNLQWPNIDLNRRLICLTPRADWTTKSGHPREIPICDSLLPFLQRPQENESVWVFPTRSGEKYERWPKTQFNIAREAAALTGGPHTLRHTYASHFLKTTADLHLLAQIMGHSDSRVTELYAHLLADHLARGRNSVNFPAPPAAE